MKKLLFTFLFSLFVVVIYLSACSSNAESTTEAETPRRVVEVGEPLHTEYFDITVNGSHLSNKIRTGNKYTDLQPEEGSFYITLKTTFKNTDTESRMVTDGVLLIDYNGKQYKFEKTETVLADGYDLILENINPMSSHTTKIVYKVPLEMRGVVYYRPARADDDEKIFIVDLEQAFAEYYKEKKSK